tara:strand:- start:67 stop:801 length:735 start_codon:yes stop_codon:yes gene_type:complete
MKKEILKKLIKEAMSEMDINEKEIGRIPTDTVFNPTPATHKIVAGEGGCDTCGVCHPNRCWECEGGGYKCDHANNFVATMDFIAKDVKPTDRGMDRDMRDRGMDDIDVAGGIPHFTYPERMSGYLQEDNKLTNNKMDLKEHKETVARFKQLAGIIKEEEDKKDEGHGYSMEELKAMMMDGDGKMVNESLFAAIGGLVGVLGAAGVISSIEMALEDPAIAEKYPKLAKVFEFLAKVGGAVGKGIK